MELARTRSSLEEEESRPEYLDPSLTILDFEARSLVQRATQQTHLEKSSGQELTQPASEEEYYATCVITGHVVSPRGTFSPVPPAHQSFLPAVTGPRHARFHYALQQATQATWIPGLMGILFRATPPLPVPLDEFCLAKDQNHARDRSG